MRPLTLALVALLVALALAGCDDSEAPARATDTPSTSATAAASPTASNTPVEPTAVTGDLPTEALDVITFERDGVELAALPVEVPPRDDYTVGLSGRYALDGRGMLFHYVDDHTARGFWMRNTHIDLDIAFVGADFEIIAIETMQAESEEIVRPDRGFQYAIEAPAGWYGEHGVQVGDRARIDFNLPNDYVADGAAR